MSLKLVLIPFSFFWVQNFFCGRPQRQAHITDEGRPRQCPYGWPMDGHVQTGPWEPSLDSPLVSSGRVEGHPVRPPRRPREHNGTKVVTM